MSWLENANRDYTITMGLVFDGEGKVQRERSDTQTFKPNWLNAKRVTDFNIATFNFHGLNGTKVVRSSIMGAVYDIEIYFQGENNLIVSDNFLEASKNNRPWEVRHPMYGSIYVQPLSLSYDDSSFNTTKITGQMMETRSNAELSTDISPIDTIQAKKLSVDTTFATSYAVDVVPITADVTAMKANVSLADRLQSAFATVKEDAELVRNTYNEVNAGIDNAFNDAFSAVSGVQRMLSLPSVFVNTIFNRINFLANCAAELYASVLNLRVPRLKKLYENNTAALISSICATSVTNVTSTDYRNRQDVVQVINILVDTYNTYVDNLNILQTETGDTPDSYIPNFDSLNQLSNLVSFTISNLFTIAQNAKQQRSVVLSRDNNVITVAFEIYGLQPDDSTIDQIINDNSISLNEIYQLKKGRNIIYYV